MQNNIFVDIWNSFRATPVWVQLWMIFILMPINIIGLFLLDQPNQWGQTRLKTVKPKVTPLYFDATDYTTIHKMVRQ